jgi:hypothetical protein
MEKKMTGKRLLMQRGSGCEVGVGCRSFGTAREGPRALSDGGTCVVLQNGCHFCQGGDPSRERRTLPSTTCNHPHRA